MDLIPFLKNKALLLLGRRDQSEYELRQKLTRTIDKYAEAASVRPDELALAIDQVIDQLKNLQLLNDAKFARNWIRQRNRSHPRGRMLLLRELQQKGIAPELIKLTLNELLEKEDEVESARRLVAKRSNKSYEQNARYLLSKGFSFDVTRKALEGGE